MTSPATSETAAETPPLQSRNDAPKPAPDRNARRAGCPRDSRNAGTILEKKIAAAGTKIRRTAISK
jgi:hypothetical protein